MVDEADQRDADQEEGQHEEAPPQQRPSPQGPRHGRGGIRAFKELADCFEVAGDGPVGDVRPEQVGPVVFWGGVVKDAGKKRDEIAAKAHGGQHYGDHERGIDQGEIGWREAQQRVEQAQREGDDHNPEDQEDDADGVEVIGQSCVVAIEDVGPHTGKGHADGKD